MRLILVICCSLYIFWGCAPTGPSSPLFMDAQPLSESTYPIARTDSVPPFVKVVQGNALIASGTFISENGLLLTSYDPVLSVMSAMSSPDSLYLSSGFAASEQDEELRIKGLSIHMEIIQRDVTAELKAGLKDSSFNYEIYTHIEEAKKELIAKETAGRDDLIAIIHDRYSGNRFMLTVYRVIDDVRLAFAPALELKADDLADTGLLSEQVRKQFSVLRVYNSDGMPFQPSSFVPLSSFAPTASDTLTAVGFPSRTYRLDTHVAFRFYHEHTNPYLLINYRNYLKKEEGLAAGDTEYALRSASGRVQTYDNVRWYESVQHSMITDSLIVLKEKQADAFNAWAEQDSLRMNDYGNIYYYIRQAIDIAQQSGDLYFATHYFLNLSILDELTGLFTQLMQADENGTLTAQAVDRTLQVQQQILTQINVEAELSHFGDALFMIQTVPEEQIPLAIYDLFDGLPDQLKEKLIARFLDEQRLESFLFDTTLARSVIDGQRFYNDRLFVILEEIISTRDFAQDNYRRHYAYLYPAQQVLVRGMLERNPDLKGDLDGYLFTNRGTILPDSDPEQSTFVTSIDFSAKAPGAAILNAEGSLIGIHVSNHPEYAANNYLYYRERSRLSVLSASTILGVLRSFTGTDSLSAQLINN